MLLYSSLAAFSDSLLTTVPAFRVIVTSVGRLVGIVMMDYPTVFTVVFDTSHQFATELEWCIAETTCVMLVFCVPALPKMISERTVKLTDRFTDVWRSWTRLGRGSRASESTRGTKDWNKRQAWPQMIGCHPNSRDRIIDEEWLQTKHTQKSTIELARSRDHYFSFNRDTAPNGCTQHPDLGIVKTVEFDYHEGGAFNMSTTQFLQQQHPWMRH